MKLFEEARQKQLQLNTRRYFLKQSMAGLGGLALSSLFGSGDVFGKTKVNTGFDTFPNFVPKAKRVIYLHMAGGPSQLELFDYKPKLKELHGMECPQSLLEGKRFAFIQGVPKMLGPMAEFQQHGQSGTYVSDNLPHLAGMVDDMTLLKAVHTDEFNHAPAQLLLQTGSPRVGRPSMGSWVTYGLGSENEDLPGFMVLVSGGKAPSAGKNAWGSGFLPSEYQGVQCRSKGDPILYVSNPNGVSRDVRRKSLDAISAMNEEQFKEFGDPEILSRVAQYEMAFKMQVSVPDAMDISKEPEYIHKMYGTKPGESAFANNCLLARRLAEKGVRFIQLYDWGWDTHGTGKDVSLTDGFRDRCKDVDKPIAALLEDLKQRGLLDETLVVWGGEFGRTPMQENRGGKEWEFYGRDHHSEAFTMWMAGGGVKKGFTFGETDEIGYYGVKDRVHVHDLQATMLHLLGINHEKLTYPFQGRNFRLTDVHGHVVNKIIA